MNTSPISKIQRKKNSAVTIKNVSKKVSTDKNKLELYLSDIYSAA